MQENNQVDVRSSSRGLQSRRLIEIRDQLRNGVNISHILNVKVSNEPDNKADASTIRKEIKRRIWNVPHLFPVPHNGEILNVSIRWIMPDAGAISAYYYGVSLPYIDEVIGAHSRIMLSSICNAIRHLHPEFGNVWGIAYLVTKPLALLRAMPQPDVDPGVVQMAADDFNDMNEDEEEDE